MEPYRYQGAAALVELHEKHLREFLEVWREFDGKGIELPPTSDPNYASREVLLAHVMGCAARYLTWMCEQIRQDPPGLEEYPEAEGFAGRAEDHLQRVLAAWQVPLRTVSEQEACRPIYPSRWETPYCIDAMLEHAVLHPIRHSHQLRKLMGEGSG